MEAEIGRTVRRPKFCPECGGRIGDDERFCGGCGGAIEAAPTGTPPAAPLQEAKEPSAAPSAQTEGRAFDAATFSAALALGSIWAIMHARSGAVRWGWLCLLGAIPAAVLVWVWARILLATFTVPYFLLRNRDDFHLAVATALLFRLATTIPMALDAARRPPFWTERQTSLRNLGLAGLATVLLGLGLDLGTKSGRTDATAAELATRIEVRSIYDGVAPDDPTLGTYGVRVAGPKTEGMIPMELLVSDDSHADGFVARQSGVYRDSLLSLYSGRHYFVVKATGPRPTYTLSIGDRVVARGDLQPRGER